LLWWRSASVATVITWLHRKIMPDTFSELSALIDVKGVIVTSTTNTFSLAKWHKWGLYSYLSIISFFLLLKGMTKVDKRHVLKVQIIRDVKPCFVNCYYLYNNNNNNNNNHESIEVTNSVQHSPSFETKSSSTSEEIFRIYGTRRCITVLTTARHLYSSWARWVQSTPFHPVALRSISLTNGLGEHMAFICLTVTVRCNDPWHRWPKYETSL
jgi:hypothetical protein